MQKLPFKFYQPHLTKKARKHRKNPTQGEKIMWEKILKNKQTGYKFLRQKPIKRFILDFYCSKLLLGIEVDGEYHEYTVIKDQERTRELNKLGIKIIRFTNWEIINNLEKVKLQILKIIKIIKL